MSKKNQKTVKNKKESLFIIVFFLVLFRLSIDYANFNLFDTMYRYTSDFMLDFHQRKYFISLIVFLVLSINAAYMIRKKTLSTIIVFFLFLLSYVPGTSLFGLLNLPNQYFLYFNIYWFLFIISCRALPKIRLARLNIVGNSHYPFYIVVVFACLFVVWCSYYFTGFRFTLSLSGQNINALREESYDFLTGIYAYLVYWIGNVIIPMAIVNFFIKKKWIPLCCVIFTQLLLFSLNGTKTWLFLIPVCLLGVIYYKDIYIKYVSFALAAVNFIGVWIYKQFGIDFITNMITRRMLVAQSINNYCYYDFFLTNQKDYLASSILRWFGARSIYTTPIPKIISAIYYHYPQSNASSGLFADAYSNFGLYGVILYPIFIVIFLKMYEAIADGINTKEIISIIIVSAIYLLNGSFFTIFLSFGLLAGMLVMFIYPRDYSEKNKQLA